MIRVCNTKEIQEIIALHQQVLGHTLNAQLGSEWLVYLYEQTLKASRNGFIYVFIEQGNILGFISGCINHAELNKQIMDNLRLSQKFKIICFFLRHPFKLLKFFQNIKFSSYLEKKYPAPYSTILTLGVDPNQQKKGIGRELITAVLQHLQAENIKDVYVDTERNNFRAQNFYLKVGFKKVAEKLDNVIFRKTF